MSGNIIRAYAAKEAGGKLERYDFDAGELKNDEVEIKVEYCGICHSDLSMMDNEWGFSRYPLVPGHEVVGEVVRMGDAVRGLKVGQKVGLGWTAESCQHCDPCIGGHANVCLQAVPTIIGGFHQGGFADKVRAQWQWVIPMPEGIDLSKAGPLLCGGITVFQPLLQHHIDATAKVGVIGIGGLGHMALQYARRMGFKVVAVGRGQEIAEDALKLGAHVYIDTYSEDTGDRLKSMGGAQAIITTIGNAEAVTTLMPGLAPRGKLVLLGAGKIPLPLAAGHLVVGERSVLGSITGTPYDNEKTLGFSVLTDVRPWIETMPLEKAFDAYQKMKSGDVKFRIVLTMNDKANAP